VAGTLMYSVSRGSGVFVAFVFGAQHAVVVGRARQARKDLAAVDQPAAIHLLAVVPNGARPAAAALPSLNGCA
jgi:hypothetical protein